MTKNRALAPLAMLLALELSGCVTAIPVAVNREQAKAAASFCGVAEYQPDPNANTPQADPDKASNNAKGAYLHCGWAKP